MSFFFCLAFIEFNFRENCSNYRHNRANYRHNCLRFDCKDTKFFVVLQVFIKFIFCSFPFFLVILRALLLKGFNGRTERHSADAGSSS